MSTGIFGGGAAPAYNITNWAAYTPTFVGLGTMGTINVEWRRVGENLEIRGNFTAGTPTAVTATMTLPNSLTVGGGVTTIHLCGRGNPNTTTNPSVKNFTILATQASNTVNFSLDGGPNAVSPIVAQNGDTVFYASAKHSIQHFSVPITGWSA